MSFPPATIEEQGSDLRLLGFVGKEAAPIEKLWPQVSDDGFKRRPQVGVYENKGASALKLRDAVVEIPGVKGANAEASKAA